MKVLMYSHMGKGEGGGEAVFRRVADGMERRGHEVIRVFFDHEMFPGSYRKEENQWWVGVSVPSRWRDFLQHNQAVGFVKSLAGLADLLWRVGPDVVNYHYFTEQAVHFALLKTILRYRFVVSCHGSDVLNLCDTPFQRQVASLVAAQADSVTCVSRALAERLQQSVFYPHTPQVIHNGIDFSFWSSNGDTGPESQEKHIVSVGSLRDVKGHDVLLQAFEQVTEQHPEATLQIVGDGPNRGSYRSMIDNAGLEDRVEITGWYSQKGVRESLNKASLFVFPSRHEGFGLALVEAMAAGCPVVATDVGGIPEAMAETSARLVPPEDPDALAEAIGEALADPDWRESSAKASRQRASQFDWETVVDEYERCLQRA